MPLSYEVSSWIQTNDDVQQAMKALYPDRFVTLGGISVIDYSHGAQVSGVISVDGGLDSELMVKQDYLVREADGTFRHYTSLPDEMAALYSARVRHINSLSEEKFPGLKAVHHPQGWQDIPTVLAPGLEKALNELSQRTGRAIPSIWPPLPKPLPLTTDGYGVHRDGKNVIGHVGSAEARQ